MVEKEDSEILRRNERLMDVIKIQTEVAKLGLDLGGVMSLVAQRAQMLTGAGAAVVELAEGEDMVYRAVSGFAEAQLGLRLKRESSLSGLCVKTGQTLQSADTALDYDRLRHGMAIA